MNVILQPAHSCLSVSLDMGNMKLLGAFGTPGPVAEIRIFTRVMTMYIIQESNINDCSPAMPPNRNAFDMTS